VYIGESWKVLVYCESDHIPELVAQTAETFTVEMMMMMKNNADQLVTATEQQWTAMSVSAKWQHMYTHPESVDGLVAKTHETQLHSQASSETDTARLLAASSTHSGDWLHAAPHRLDRPQTVR